MSVYVDDMEAVFGRMVTCHIIADSREELDAMADQIGVARRWIQDAGTWREHYDICKSKRARAIAAGTRPISRRELGQRLIMRRPDPPTPRAGAPAPE